jgi:rhodanese-related sulfurtransferase
VSWFEQWFGVRSIAPGELQQRLAEGAVTAIDVNSADSWTEAHVPGALHLDPGRLDPSGLPADKEAPLVFYCSNPWCRKAPTAARTARKLGYRNVRVMRAGIQGWIKAGLPTTHGG